MVVGTRRRRSRLRCHRGGAEALHLEFSRGRTGPTSCLLGAAQAAGEPRDWRGAPGNRQGRGAHSAGAHSARRLGCPGRRWGCQFVMPAYGRAHARWSACPLRYCTDRPWEAEPNFESAPPLRLRRRESSAAFRQGRAGAGRVGRRAGWVTHGRRSSAAGRAAALTLYVGAVVLAAVGELPLLQVCRRVPPAPARPAW